MSYVQRSVERVIKKISLEILNYRIPIPSGSCGKCRHIGLVTEAYATYSSRCFCEKYKRLVETCSVCDDFEKEVTDEA